MKKHTVAPLLCALMAQPVMAGDFVIGLGLGAENVKIDKKYDIENNSASDGDDGVTMFSNSLYAGYRFDNQINIHVGLSNSESMSVLGLFDSASLYSFYLQGGYSFAIPPKLSLEPNLTLTRTQLITKEGIFLNEGEEASTNTKDTTIGFGVTTNYALTNRLDLSGSYRFNSPVFGHTHFGLISLAWKIPN